MNRYFQNRTDITSPLESVIVANSTTLAVGSIVGRVAGGFVGVATAEPYGKVVGFVDARGVNLERGSAAPIAGTYNKTTDTFVSAANNQTVDKVRAVVQTFRGTDRLVLTLDANRGTTSGSGTPFNQLSLASGSSLLLDESAVITDNSGQFEIDILMSDIDALRTIAADEVIVRPVVDRGPQGEQGEQGIPG